MKVEFYSMDQFLGTATWDGGGIVVEGGVERGELVIEDLLRHHREFDRLEGEALLRFLTERYQGMLYAVEVGPGRSGRRS